MVITAIVVRDRHFFIMQRPYTETKFPGRWTVPGGKLSTADYTDLPKDTPDYWYNVLERALKREVMEEAGIEIKNVRYVTSLASAELGKDPSIVISCLADWASGEGRVSDEMIDCAWVDLLQAKTYDLIGGIWEELEMANRMLRAEERGEWRAVSE